MNNIAIFASGSGTNAQAIIDYFQSENRSAHVELVLSNRADAYVLQRAANSNIKTVTFSTKELKDNPLEVLSVLQNHAIDFIVLAGFMVLMPSEIVAAYPNKIVNIHPALLPKYGGKGMYGDNVHRAVVEAKESFSGITIHYVNEKYDDGAIVFQAQTELSKGETPESLAQKIHTLEHKYYPQTIENILLCKK